jgi:aminoglycoside phosphotransferase (APT) family kinase protein
MVGPGEAVLRWAVSCVDPAASVTSATALHRLGSPWLLRLSRSPVDEVVLRVGDPASRALLATEAAALEAIAGSGIPGPRLLGVAIGAAETPHLFAVLTTRVPGASQQADVPSTDRLRALGAAIALVHAAHVPTSAHLPLRARPIEPVDFDAVRRAEPSRSLLVEAEQFMRRTTVPRHRPVFVHGDFWHGNTMWKDDRLAGIIDWECAGVGHPGIDLGMQRCDAALVAGPEAADDVLAGYGSAGGTAADIAYWDIAAALTTPPTMESFVQTIIGQGRTDLDPQTLLERRDAFLATALERVRDERGCHTPCASSVHGHLPP